MIKSEHKFETKLGYVFDSHALSTDFFRVFKAFLKNSAYYLLPIIKKQNTNLLKYKVELVGLSVKTK